MGYPAGVATENAVPLVEYLRSRHRRTVTAFRLIEAGYLAAWQGSGGWWVDQDQLEEALAAQGEEVDRAAAERRRRAS